MSDPATIHGWSITNIAAASPQTDTLVKTGRSILHAIHINGPATTAGVLTVRDGTSATGTAIAIIDLSTFTQETDTSTFTAGDVFAPHGLYYDVEMSTGIFLDFDGTVAGCNISVIYY